MDALISSLKTCPACQSTAVSYASDYRGAHGMFSGLDRLACGSCGLNFADPMPSAQDLEAFNASYFDNAHGGVAGHAEQDAFFSGLAALRVAHVESYLSECNVKVANILEIGPGAGHFAAQWLKRFPGSSYRAIETDTTCHANLNRLGVHLLRDGEQALDCDLVIISHVLEHVSTPSDFLSSIIQSLRPGGVIFIEVPCNDWQHKDVDEPHLLFFDKKPMGLLLDRLGLVDIHLSYHGRLISDLRSESTLRKLARKVQSRLLRWGLTFPFALSKKGMEVLSSPMERAMIAPFEAHLEQSSPAWWLRALATKKKGSCLVWK